MMLFLMITKLYKGAFGNPVKKPWLSGSQQLKREYREQAAAGWQEGYHSKKGFALLLNSIDRRFYYPEFSDQLQQDLKEQLNSDDNLDPFN